MPRQDRRRRLRPLRDRPVPGCADPQPGGRLIVTVVENPVINRVAFEGNKKVKDEQLLLEVQSKPRGTLRARWCRPTCSASSRSTAAPAASTSASSPKIIELPNNRVDLVFEINEGSKTGVRMIIFVGNSAFSRLSPAGRDQDRAKPNLLSFLKTNDVYDPDRIEADRELMRRFYLKNGYADVRVVSAIAEFDPGEQGLHRYLHASRKASSIAFGAVDVAVYVRGLDADALRSAAAGQRPARSTTPKRWRRSVEDMTVEAARRGFRFRSGASARRARFRRTTR